MYNFLNLSFYVMKSLIAYCFFCLKKVHFTSELLVSTKLKFLFQHKRFYSLNYKIKDASNIRDNHVQTAEVYYNYNTNTVDMASFNLTHAPVTTIDGQKYVNQSVGFDQQGRANYLVTQSYQIDKFKRIHDFINAMKNKYECIVSSNPQVYQEIVSTYIEIKIQDQSSLMFSLKQQTKQAFIDKTIELFKNIKKD